MVRSTRLLSSPESRLLISPPTSQRRPHRRSLRPFADFHLGLGPTNKSSSYSPKISVFSNRLVYCLAPSHRRRLDRPLPPTMDRAGDSSSGSDASAAAEEYVHVSSADPIEAVAAAEEAAPNPNPNPNISADSELLEAPMWSSIKETAFDSVDDMVLGGLGGPEVAYMDGGEELKRVLPEELSKGVVVLECESLAEGGTCDVYLVGTAHVSQVIWSAICKFS